MLATELPMFAALAAIVSVVFIVSRFVNLEGCPDCGAVIRDHEGECTTCDADNRRIAGDW